MIHRFLLAGLSVFTVVALIACADDAGESVQHTTNGVNDVSKACAIRAAWTKTTIPECTDCLSISTVPRCPCSVKEYAGSCSTQKNATTAEPTCDGVGECVFKCAHGDCACVDTCYAGRDACRQRAAALDGCLAEICDTYCR